MSHADNPLPNPRGQVAALALAHCSASGTPRTDAAIQTVDVAFVGYDGLSSSPEQYVSPDFARELERENDRLRDACERAQRHIRGQNKSEWSAGWLWRDECLNAIEAALSPNVKDEPRPI